MTQETQKDLAVTNGMVLLVLVLMISGYFMLLVQAQKTYTIMDGDNTVTCSSSAAAIEEVLAEAGISIGEDDLVIATEAEDVTEVLIQRCHSVTVVCGDEVTEVETYAATVEELFADLNLTLGSSDIISDGIKLLALSDRLYERMEISLTCYTQKTVTEITALDFTTEIYLDPTLSENMELVKVAGVQGQQEITYLQEYINGELSSVKVVSSRVISAPVTEIVLKGQTQGCAETEDAVEIYTEPEAEPEEAESTQDLERTETQVISTDKAVENETTTVRAEAIEKEETTETVEKTATQEETTSEKTVSLSDVAGNAITTASGQVLYYSEVLTVEATAYTGGGTTATGTSARYGAIAVDPTVIPYGTRMYIMTEDGSWIYGIATAEDCGGAIKGNKIDLYFDDYSTCIQFGRRSCTVYILE